MTRSVLTWRLSWHLTQYFVIRRGIVAKILCPECTTYCGLHTPQSMWRIWIIGCCRDNSTRRVYFAINGVMSVWMYSSSTHIVVEDAAVGRVILGGQQVDGEECRHSPSAWSGWHQSLISTSKIILKQSAKGQMIPMGPSQNVCTGCPQKNALLTLEANISGLEAPIGKSWTSFENYMFSAFIWAQEQVNSIQASQRKLAFKKITWTILIISLVLVQVIF